MARSDPTGAPKPIAGERLRELFADRDDRDAVAIVDGFGVRLSVDRGQLRALDGGRCSAQILEQGIPRTSEDRRRRCNG